MVQEREKTLRRSYVAKVVQGRSTSRRCRAADTVFINTDLIQLQLDYEKLLKVDGRSKFVRTVKKYYGV